MKSMPAAIILSTLAFTEATPAQMAAVDFEGLATGSRFGPGSSGMQMPGNFIFNSMGIEVTIGNFLPTNNTTSAFVEVNPADPTVFDSNYLEHFANISLQYDFTQLAFEVGLVTIEWYDFGGTQTLGVNGDLVALFDFTDAPATLGGVGVTVVNQVGVNTPGTITFRGDINTITIGGQELAVDNLVATVPTPGVTVVALIVAGTMSRRRRTN